MLREDIQSLLSTKKVNSISDIICFIIEQVNKKLTQQPFEQIHYRLLQLQKSKGLDTIMIQQVKTIAEALIDQRQQNIRFDFQKALTQQTQNIQHLVSNFNNYAKKTSRPSLAQIDIMNLLNSNSISYQDQNRKASLSYQDDIRKTRQSYRQNQLIKDNLLSDCNILKQKINSDKKQIGDLKYSLLEINRNMSNKISLEEAHKIISQFEGRIYKKVQAEKLDIQRLEFQLKKQLQQQILKVRKQVSIQNDIQILKKQILSTRKHTEKLQKKLQKYKQQTKTLSKQLKNITGFQELLFNSQQKIRKQLEKNQSQFLQYCKFNNSKNEDLNIILEEINQKLIYFEKVDELDKKLNEVNKNYEKIGEQISNIVSCNSKGSWITTCKTKNQSIVWQKEVYNFNPCLFKFESQKSQILITQPSIYFLQFSLLETKTSHLSGIILIQSLNLQSPVKQIKTSGGHSFRTILQIDQRSLISIKLIGGQSTGSLGGKGILKISRY